MGAPEQFDLPMKPPMQRLDADVLARLPNMTAAILLCQQISGLSDSEVAKALGLDAAQWSRVKSGGAHFPQERLNKLMDVCGNEAPLLWIANRRGYELKELESETQRQLRIERESRERVERENKLLRDLLTGRAA